jgi:hypothetical protein
MRLRRETRSSRNKGKPQILPSSVFPTLTALLSAVGPKKFWRAFLAELIFFIWATRFLDFPTSQTEKPAPRPGTTPTPPPFSGKSVNSMLSRVSYEKLPGNLINGFLQKP